MTTVQNVGVVPPLPVVGESRTPLTLPGQRVSQAQTSTTADQVKSQADESAKAAAVSRAHNARSTDDQVKVADRAFTTKSGLIQGTFDAFVDIVDPRYQTRIARIFGPEAGGAAANVAPNLVPSVVSKAYEAIDGSGKSGAFRQSA
ncbi:MAG: hypothetical protein HY059_03105 [Proteobacteria bacterium]|nr:hypothetical protein [Pseudomonadota bacterium]